MSEDLQNTRALTFFDNGIVIRRCVIESNIKYAPRQKQVSKDENGLGSLTRTAMDVENNPFTVLVMIWRLFLACLISLPLGL